MPAAPRLVGSVMVLTLAFALASPAFAQYQLAPGDVVIADHGVEFGHKTIVLRKADGTVLEPARNFDFDNSGFSLSGVADVAIDGRGSILALIFDPTSQSPAVYRIEPTGLFSPVVGRIGNDAFSLAVDKFGNILIANGFGGLLRVTPDGEINDPGRGIFASGVVVGSNGDYFVTSAAESKIYRVTPSGDVSEFFSGVVLLNAIGIVRDNADNLFVANAGRRDILRFRPDATLSVFSRANAFTFPTDIGLTSGGKLIAADGGTSGTGLDAVFEVATNGNARPLIFDTQDGLADGLPIDDPFGIAVVPNLFVTYAGQAVRGGQLVITVQGTPNSPFLIGLSTGPDRTPLSAIFPADDRYLDLDLSRLVGQLSGTFGHSGARVFNLQIPIGQPTGRYFVQAVTFNAGTGKVADISNVISAEVF